MFDSNIEEANNEIRRQMEFNGKLVVSMSSAAICPGE